MKKTLIMVAILMMAFMVWGQTSPINESFSNLGPYGGYQTETWTGDDGGTWTATDARTDQTINGKAICIRNGVLTSPTVSGGIGSLTVTTQRAFAGGTGDMNVTVNGTLVGTVPYDGTEQTTTISDINIAGDIVVVIDATNSSSDRPKIDDLIWTAHAGGGPLPPSISNIVQSPDADITSSTTVSVSADVTAGDAAIDYVELHYGTTSGSLTNTIAMSLDTGDTYVTDSDIPAQTDGTTVYYEVYAVDVDTEESTSAEQSYTVTDPVTTTLPYEETFDADLGECYTYSVSGDTKEWNWNSSGWAQINGFNSGDTEEDWLILPGINLDNFTNEVMTFETWYNYGSDDANNYLKLYYSTDYAGLGDPSSASWTELSYTKPSTAQTWTGSGNIDLSGISGTSVWIAFEYHYGSGSYRWWQIDNLSILEVSVDDPTDFTATATSTTEIDLSWALNGSSDDVMIAMGYSNAFGEPVDGTSYSVGDTSLSDGGEVIYKGSGTSYTHTTYDSNIHCYFKAWSVDSSNNYSPGVEDDATTFKEEPTNHVTDFTATENGYNQVDLSWTNNDGAQAADAFILFASTDSYGAISDPIDGTEYTDDTDMSDGSGNVIVNNVKGTYSWSGLAELTTYYYKIYPFTNSGTEIDYKTDGTIPQNDATTEEEPVMNPPAEGVVFISEVSDAASDFNTEYIELFNNSSTTIDLSNCSIVMNETTYFPIANYTGDTTIPANGLFIMTRVETLAAFETEWGALPANCNYNEGVSTMYFGTGTARRWQLVYDDGTKADVIIDDTMTAVAGSGNRTYQEPIGTWNTDSYANATPGNLDGDQALPVTLSYFAATFQNGYSTISWQTQSEVNNSHWNIYRSNSENFGQAEKINVNPINGEGTTSEMTEYSYDDVSDLVPGNTYYYWLESVDFANNTLIHEPVDVVIPEEEEQDIPPAEFFGLAQNYPNPFNPDTEILFALENGGHATITIYNVKGEKVTTLFEGTVQPDVVNRETWNGTNQNGRSVASGIYFYRLESAERTEMKKMLLVK